MFLKDQQNQEMSHLLCRCNNTLIHENYTLGSLLWHNAVSLSQMLWQPHLCRIGTLIRHILSKCMTNFFQTTSKSETSYSWLLQMEFYKAHCCVAVLEPYSVCRGNTTNPLLPNAKLNRNPDGWQNAKWKNKVKEFWVVQRKRTVLNWRLQRSPWWGNNDNIWHFNIILHLSVPGCFTTWVTFRFRTCLVLFWFY